MRIDFPNRIKYVLSDVKSETYIAILLGVALLLLAVLGLTAGFAFKNLGESHLKIVKNPVVSSESHIFIRQNSLFLEDLPVTLDEMETTLIDLKNRRVVDTVYVIPEKTVVQDRIDTVIAVLRRVGIEHIILEINSPPWNWKNPENNPSIAKSRKDLSITRKYPWTSQFKNQDQASNIPISEQPDLTRTPSPNPITQIASEVSLENQGIPELNSPMNGSEKKNSVDLSIEKFPEIDISFLKASYQKKILEKIDRMKVYPPIARRMSHQGRVLISFTLGSDGSITNPVIAQKSSFGELDYAALDTVHRSTPFEPIPSELELKSMNLSIWINFNLND